MHKTAIAVFVASLFVAAATCLWVSPVSAQAPGGVYYICNYSSCLNIADDGESIVWTKLEPTVWKAVFKASVHTGWPFKSAAINAELDGQPVFEYQPAQDQTQAIGTCVQHGGGQEVFGCLQPASNNYQVTVALAGGGRNQNSYIYDVYNTNRVGSKQAWAFTSDGDPLFFGSEANVMTFISAQ